MTDRKDPYAQFNFVLEINGLDVAGFTEVSGINSESDIIEYREGSDASTVRKLPCTLGVAQIHSQRANRAQTGRDCPARRKREEPAALGIL